MALENIIKESKTKIEFSIFSRYFVEKRCKQRESKRTNFYPSLPLTAVLTAISHFSSSKHAHAYRKQREIPSAFPSPVNIGRRLVSFNYSGPNIVELAIVEPNELARAKYK